MAVTTPALPGRLTARRRTARRATAWISASSTRASARDAMPAVSKSSTTASGVTMPRGVVAIWMATVPAATSRGVADPAVDVDRFITTNQSSWSRLEHLTAAAGGARARLAPAEVDELVQLYQRASTHLSHARTQHADPALVARLTRLVASSGGVIYSTRSRSLS